MVVALPEPPLPAPLFTVPLRVAMPCPEVPAVAPAVELSDGPVDDELPSDVLPVDEEEVEVPVEPVEVPVLCA